MGLLKEGSFLLDNSLKTIFLECISDCLGTYRVGDDGVNEFGGLNSIIQLSSSDLANDCLFVTRRELGRTASFVVFLVRIHLLFDSSNS